MPGICLQFGGAVEAVQRGDDQFLVARFHGGEHLRVSCIPLLGALLVLGEFLPYLPAGARQVYGDEDQQTDLEDGFQMGGELDIFLEKPP